jgi:hypothetical protein
VEQDVPEPLTHLKPVPEVLLHPIILPTGWFLQYLLVCTDESHFAVFSLAVETQQFPFTPDSVMHFSPVPFSLSAQFFAHFPELHFPAAAGLLSGALRETPCLEDSWVAI